MVDIALRDGQIDAEDNLLPPEFYSPQARHDLIAASNRTRARTRTGSSRKGIKTNIRCAEAARAQDQGPAVAAAALNSPAARAQDSPAARAHNSDPIRLDGKRALVTGASRGIGRAAAEALAAAGASVAINYARSTAEAEDAAAAVRACGNGEVEVIQADVAIRGGEGDVRPPRRGWGGSTS